MTSDRVVIVGAGIIGLCTAHYLQEAGFGVTVIEKNQSVAEGASQQNGALLTPSMSDPWNAPGVHWQLLKYLGRSDAPMLLRPAALHHYMGWGLRFLRNATTARFTAASLANLSLSLFSLRKMVSLRSVPGVHYTWRATGALNVFRDSSGFAAARRRATGMAEYYPDIECLTAGEVANKEPVLGEVAGQLAGGIYYPLDETGDAREFCNSLAQSLVDRGVKFQFGTEVKRVLVPGRQVTAVQTDNGMIETQQVVVAAAALTPMLARGQGIHIKPVKGYSISVPMQSLEHFPTIPIVDDGLHAAVTPLDERLRIAGTAEFCGWDTRLDSARVDNLWNLLAAVSPLTAANADRDSATPWCGLRPMAADGLPYIGETRAKGLWVNAGHGHLGWSQAAGSGALLAAEMAGEEAGISAVPFSPLRNSRSSGRSQDRGKAKVAIS